MIAENIADIKRKINAAAEASQRGNRDVVLVAATKTQSAEDVRAAVAAGIGACGENRVQEMLVKLNENAYHGAPLHFIGHLQTNKVSDVVGRVDLIQSIDSFRLAQTVERAAAAIGVRQEVLLEVKLGDEPNKTGFAPAELNEAVEKITRFEHICVRGIMAIPPVVSSKSVSLENFNYLYKIYVDIIPKIYDNRNRCILSMGMSGDYELAIACGATMVRVGSAIFGERNC